MGIAETEKHEFDSQDCSFCKHYEGEVSYLIDTMKGLKYKEVWHRASNGEWFAEIIGVQKR